MYICDASTTVNIINLMKILVLWDKGITFLKTQPNLLPNFSSSTLFVETEKHFY